MGKTRSESHRMEESLTTRSAKDVWLALKKLLPYIVSHRVSMVVVIVAMLISIAISISMGFGLSYVVDRFPADPVAGSVFLDELLVVVISVVFVFFSVKYISGYILQKVATKVAEKIRCDIFNNIVDQDLEYIERQNSGDMQTRIVADTNAVGRFLTMQVPVIFSAVLSLIGGIIGALYISTKLTLIVLVFAPLVFLPFIIFAKRLRYFGERVQSAISDVGRFSGEAFRNIKVMKAYNKEIDEKQKFSGYAVNTTDYILRSIRLSLVIRSVVSASATIAAAVLLWHFAKSIYANTMTIGQLMAFAYFARLIVGAAQQFVGIVTSTNVIVGKAQKVMEFLETERHSWPSPIGDFPVEGGIEFKDICFGYPNRPDTVVLKGINLVIKAGTHVAIVGPSGAGKSTMFDLLLRLYNPQQGTIYFDGTDSKDFGVEQLRAFMGFVPQRESLISGSVFDNISYGTKNADEASVALAGKKANADDFIQQLPQGYNTDLGEIGNRLSGGQKQRISLARALIRNPQILLLDEANSALDAESDRLLSEAIMHWAKTEHKTVITIAHRLSTARHADLIVVMDNGSIVGQGSHEELLKTSPVYHSLASAGSQGFGESMLEVV